MLNLCEIKCTLHLFKEKHLIHMTENEKDNYSTDLHMDGIGFFINPIN